MAAAFKGAEPAKRQANQIIEVISWERRMRPLKGHKKNMPMVSWRENPYL
jgi:hypothetical protein